MENLLFLRGFLLYLFGKHHWKALPKGVIGTESNLQIFLTPSTPSKGRNLSEVVGPCRKSWELVGSRRNSSELVGIWDVYQCPPPCVLKTRQGTLDQTRSDSSDKFRREQTTNHCKFDLQVVQKLARHARTNIEI